jgi:PKD repeat protein
MTDRLSQLSLLPLVLLACAILVVPVSLTYGGQSLGSAVSATGALVTAPIRSTLEAGMVGPSSAMLSHAVASLATGEGPAAGNALRCTSAGTSDERCGPTAAGDLSGEPKGRAAESNESWWNVTAAQTYLGSPGAGYFGSMTYAPSFGVVYFGGCDLLACPDNELWFYSGSWQLQSASGSRGGPPARYGASMTYDSFLGEVVLFGGCGVTVCPLSDTWVLDPNYGWINITADACSRSCPPGLYGASMVANDSVVGSGDILFGGCLDRACDQVSNQTWSLSYNAPYDDRFPWYGVSWSRTGQGLAPPARAFASMAYLSTAHAAFLFGGTCGADCHDLNDTWYFNSSGWHNATSELVSAGSLVPPARDSAAITYDPRVDGLVLFGGFNQSASTTYGDTWIFQCDTVCSWSTAAESTAPPPAFGAAIPGNSSGKDLILFGGKSSETNASSNSTWIWGIAPAFTPMLSPDPAEVNGTVVFTGGGAAGMSYALNLTPYHAAKWGETWRGDYYIAFPAWFGAVEGTSSNLSFPLPSAGTVLVTASIFDTFGGSSTEQFTLTVLPAPNVSVSRGPLLADAGVETSLSTIPCTDCGVAPFNYTWSFDEYIGSLYSEVTIGWGASIEYAFPAPGTYIVDLLYQDAFNVAQTTLTVQVNQPPSVAAAPILHPTDVGLVADFAASATNGTSPDLFSWDFGDGGVSTGASTSHEFANAGVYPVSVTVIDAAGGRATAVESIVVNSALEASAAALGSPPEAGVAVGLIAAVSGGTGPTLFSWTLGDGSVASGPFVNHAFARPGLYTINFTATDTLGEKADTTFIVNVLAVPSPPFAPPQSSTPTTAVSGTALTALVVAGTALGVTLTLLAITLTSRRQRP